MLIAFGFRFLTLDRIYSSCLPDNAGARRVLEKLGFRYTHEGPMPDPGPDRVNACCTSSSAGGSGRPGPHNDRRSRAAPPA